MTLVNPRLNPREKMRPRANDSIFTNMSAESSKHVSVKSDRFVEDGSLLVFDPETTAYLKAYGIDLSSYSVETRVRVINGYHAGTRIAFKRPHSIVTIQKGSVPVIYYRDEDGEYYKD